MDEKLKQQFDELGIDPTAEVLAKSIDLCITYHIDDAAEFVEQWVAYSISHLNGDEPTVDTLLEFERKVLQVKREKELAASAKKKTPYAKGVASLSHINTVPEANPLPIYGVSGDDVNDYSSKASASMVGIDDDDILGAYNVQHTPKSKRAFPRTPARHGDTLFSPVSYSPIAGTPRTHIAAAGSGKIVYTFGNAALIGAAQWGSQQQKKIHIKQLLQHDGATLGAAGHSQYMLDTLADKCEIAGSRLDAMAKCLCRKVFGADAEEYNLQPADVHSQELNSKSIGTIFCDNDGPLDATAVMLVGTDEARCRTVRLNFSKAKSVGVFPGQIVMVSGVNPRGDVFMVEEVLAERELSLPSSPKIADQLTFVVAAGPFTHDDDLVYDPLQDLMCYLKDHKPDVLILAGPFLDANHKLISETTTLAETFDSFFQKMIAGIVEVLGMDTSILLLASHRDAHADAVYPTMPLSLKNTYTNVHLLPDPSLIDLNGIVIGMTSVDIVDHLISQELAVNAGDKVKRTVNYLLQQGSFYPLNPPVEDKMCFDSVLANKFAKLEQVPNILILPSDQKCFIRVVNGCLAINPGRLADSTHGTFARIIVTPPTPKEEGNIFNYVGCQVRKV